MARAGELGADQALTFLREVDTINLRRRVQVVELAREACGGSFVGRRIAVLGAAFKPHSDDIRDSPALNVAAQAQAAGRRRRRHRPGRRWTTRSAHWPDLHYAATAEEAVAGRRRGGAGHRVARVRRRWTRRRWPAIARGRSVIDARNALDPAAWRAAGWTYRGLGRSSDIGSRKAA